LATTSDIYLAARRAAVGVNRIERLMIRALSFNTCLLVACCRRANALVVLEQQRHCHIDKSFIASLNVVHDRDWS
jgi:hypothetical protein